MIIFCTVASCFSANLVFNFSLFALLGFWRVLLGIGKKIGGDYISIAVKASEFANTKTRGKIKS